MRRLVTGIRLAAFLVVAATLVQVVAEVLHAHNNEAEIPMKILEILPTPFTYFLLACGGVVIFLAMIGAVTLFRHRTIIEEIKSKDTHAAIEQNYKKGDMVSVVSDCRVGLIDYPNDVVLHWYLALATYAQKDFETSRAHFKKAIAIDPRYESQALSFLEQIGMEWKPKVVK